ncbi:protein FAR1-RELATED SEQUENCE 5-like [Arachis hypogaea]|uniref:protein FAR1-RELATED SEQUENCE 5-like n=1 Tax=Arachis hypogaea TaxID=3818 RepID=UPI0007AEFBEC
MQMMNMLKSGISTLHIFGLLASQAGGYEFIGYDSRDMYNEIARQRHQVPGDATRVLKKLEDMRQLGYQLFGDVITFDATYKKLSISHIQRVNHDNQTIVFAAALMWTKLLIYLAPTLAHICNEGKIMLGDYKILVFKQKWVHLIEEFGLEDKPWVNNMYEEKHMWTTAYIRGKLFTGVRTTSRCEGLHSVVARYVGSRYDLTNFVEHFQRCVTHLRFKKFNDDYESTRGVPVMQTCIELLERFAAEVYTQEIFLLFWPFLSRVGSTRVLNIKNHDDCLKYIVCKHGRPDFLWTVEFHQEEIIFMCSCLRMESFGILCEYIVKVMVDRDICEILRSLVLDRWTKKMKSALNDASGFTRNAVVISRQSALMEFSK